MRCAINRAMLNDLKPQLEPTPGGGVTEVMEAKGLDIVRRDWCPLSKDAGSYALQQILSGATRRGPGGRGPAAAAVQPHMGAGA
jgi:hypothetical protein